MPKIKFCIYFYSVLGKGDAEINSSLTFDYLGVANSIIPLVGGFGGNVSNAFYVPVQSIKVTFINSSPLD